jgi:ribosomal protein S18 acetylase RimI-like enzyme
LIQLNNFWLFFYDDLCLPGNIFLKIDFWISERQVILSPVTPADEGFLFRVYASTRADEMALVAWTGEQKQAFLQMQFRAQSQHYQAVYPQAIDQVIAWGGIPIGRLTLDRSEETTFLVDLALLPEFRHRGVGAALISALQSENRKINLHVLKGNPASNLYRRLGFVFKSEDALYFEMEWIPEVNT